ncbi:MAG: ATP-grasp domain-containing protein [Mesorhizobium sp.]|uniref:D-alanine--D-alanine ligase family protein n=1 Tax=Mesorhizobium sp. TaxID=1871066 RepID=UPI00121E569A|nr:ATP-grasp domain-containing protein [Mesorhizobium sp.]TIR48683.1 MAG: ATP-grasp domain-containing protein [Mesorhizobium sp.]
MRVAIVTNSDYNGVINRFGQLCPHPPEHRTQEQEDVVAALQQGGHETLLCEGDKRLLATLERFMPPGPQARPSGMVFNLAEGIQGEKRETHVAAMLEMAGVPYTGSSPLGIGLTNDKVITKMLLRDQGVPTPNFRVMRRGTESAADLQFPVVVKPRYEDGSLGLQLVHEHSKLKQAVEVIATQYAQDALVEEYIEGREIYVALLGNEELEVLPLVERDFGDRETRLMDWDAKFGATAAVPKICPAQIESGLETMLRDISVATFRACHCRDYARVDFRLDRSGQPFVLEMNSPPSLGMHNSYATAATSAGYSFSSLINGILNVAHIRCFGFGIR